MSFDPEERAALRRACFTVPYDRNSALVEGSMRVTVANIGVGLDLAVQIVLPSGMRLECTATRGAILGINHRNDE